MPNVGEEIIKAVKKQGRGKYERAKSEKGGIQDQLNCVYSFMEGYMSQADESDSGDNKYEDDKICVTPAKTRKKAQVYQYRTGKAQWQLSAIEAQAKIWNLTYVQIFQLGEFLYCYCPQFEGSEEDFRRLRTIGVRTANRGKGPMEVLTMAKFDKNVEALEELKRQFAAIGHDLTFTIK
jgi:hypothetical protein